MLWLAIHLPHLALELFPPCVPPFAVVDGAEQRPLVHSRNRAAAALGIGRGMPLSAARSLCADLVVQPRRAAAEQAALEQLALWAGQYTSQISLQPNGLLLEIGGSLALFGGLASLQSQIDAGLRDLGYHPYPGIAPTPLGAWLLARARDPEPATDRAALTRRLHPLPIELLEVSAQTLHTLRGLGLATLGDCLRLPRAGLARRLTPDLLLHLDRAFGLLPDPRPSYTPPMEFNARIALPAETANIEALLFPLRRLLLQLSGLLRAKGAGVQELQLHLEHRQRSASRITLGLLQPSRDSQHLLALLRERLDRFDLPAPVEAVALHTARFPALDQEHHELFAAPNKIENDRTTLIERLRARLGNDAVHGLALHTDHRPEKAWKTCAPATANTTQHVQAENTAATARPLWLLPAAQPQSLLGLRLLRGPERIESGWWDGADAARDYYIALTPQGQRLWVYRDNSDSRWWVQGEFG
ncbi:MAG: DNA polymerase Y family protein [Pseudomonadota bacterium]